jgi:hypothetical protein
MSIDHAAETDTAQLAAEIALDQPSLTGTVRRSAARICKYAALLEAELGRYRPLVGYLEDAVKLVEHRTGRTVDEKLFACLLDRLGMTDADLAMERLQQARPNA